MVNITNQTEELMFGLKKKMGRPPKQVGVRATYKPLAVTPEAHAKLRKLADQKHQSMIDTFSELVGV